MWEKHHTVPEPPIQDIIDDYTKARKQQNDPIRDVTLKKFEFGYGTHKCDNECIMHSGKCYAHHVNSDWIVTIGYTEIKSGDRYVATYGVYNGEYSLWMD